MKAADIPDETIIKIILDLRGDDPAWPNRWVSIWEIQKKLSEFPPKVVVAKMNSLVRRGIVTGCTCGCRGDFELTELSEPVR